MFTRASGQFVSFTVMRLLVSSLYRVIFCIEDPKVITKILDHLKLPSQPPTPWPAKSSRGPPDQNPFMEVLDTALSSEDFNQTFLDFEFN